ncbi:hypothetical protein BTVI_40212 [Pitangus sulphuratus]|nr:hypothetical protein BTVI_40212 [Pitangus sulphuratus]
MKRFHWVVLPQGMRDSSTIYQTVVAKAICPVRELYPSVIIYHYMDDILVATAQETDLPPIMTALINAVRGAGLQVTPEKIQRTQPWVYLGWKITQAHLQELNRRDPEIIYVPVTKDNLDWLLAEDAGFQTALADCNSDILSWFSWFLETSPGYDWFSGLQVHIARSCPVSHPPELPSPSWQDCSRSVHILACIDTGGCPKPRHSTLHLALLNLMGPFHELVQVPLDGILSLRCVNHTTQLGVICKLAEGALNPFVYVIDEDIK